jgi:hypothetical protein
MHFESFTLILLGAFAEFQKATTSFVLSICPHGSTWLPLGGFSLNLVCEDFSENCQENTSLIKI